MRTDDFGRRLVTGLADALNAHDLVRARSYLADDLHFVGMFGPPIDGADAYLDAMARIGAQQVIVKCLVERDEVACQYYLSPRMIRYANILPRMVHDQRPPNRIAARLSDATPLRKA